jgi:hypothetical protein
MIRGTHIIIGQILTYIFKFAHCVFRQSFYRLLETYGSSFSPLLQRNSHRLQGAFQCSIFNTTHTTDTAPYESGNDVLVSSIIRKCFTRLQMSFFTSGKYTFLYVAHFAKGVSPWRTSSFCSTCCSCLRILHGRHVSTNTGVTPMTRNSYQVLFKSYSVYNIMTCFDTRCTMLQVILTPTCRVSGYPRQVIKIGTLYLTALTRHLQYFELVYLPLFFDDRCLLESLLTRLLHWTASFYYCRPFTTALLL